MSLRMLCSPGHLKNRLKTPFVGDNSKKFSDGVEVNLTKDTQEQIKENSLYFCQHPRVDVY